METSFPSKGISYQKVSSLQPLRECELVEQKDARIINDSNPNGEQQQQVLSHKPSPITTTPLPLSQPRVYWGLVLSVYRSSYAIILGNMLEWLDFGIFGYSEAEISQQLFAGSHTVGWLMFGMGYAVRPLGAFWLGRLADTQSRKLAFIMSVMGMATATAFMSCIPALCGQPHVTTSYCVSHMWMTALPAVVLRVVQGIAAGGAAGGVNVIQSELWSTRERRGALTQSVGVNNVSGAAASMLSAAIVLGLRAVMGREQYAAIGWRVAFLIVIPPSLMASFLTHSSMPESNEYAQCNGHLENETTITTTSPEYDALGKREEPLSDSKNPTLDERPWVSPSNRHNSTPMWLLLAVSIYIQFTIAAYNNLNVYMVQYAKENYGVNDNTATLMAVIGKAIQVLTTLPAAWLGDVQGWFGTAAWGGILCSVLAVPMMAASKFGGLPVAWALVAFVEPAVATLWILTAPLLATSIFPVKSRSKWTSMVMATGVAVAGFFPLLLNQTQNLYVTGNVLAIVAALGTMGIVWIRQCAKKGLVQIYQRPELY